MDKVSVFIIYDRAIDEEILDTLTVCCIDRYTRWHDASGVGESGPHLGDHIWPALNNVMMTVVEVEKKDEILKKIRALQEEFPFVGLRAVVLPVLDMV
jgi:hypothetical protein